MRTHPNHDSTLGTQDWTHIIFSNPQDLKTQKIKRCVAKKIVRSSAVSQNRSTSSPVYLYLLSYYTAPLLLAMSSSSSTSSSSSNVLLSPYLVGRILSYNVGSTADLARLRLALSNSTIDPYLTQAVVESAHFIRIPGRRSLNESFVNELPKYELEWDEDEDEEVDGPEPLLEVAWRDIQDSRKLVEGVAIVDRLLTTEVVQTLNERIDAFAHPKSIDDLAHPNSNNVVLDIVHPALYVYVKDQTPRRKKLDEEPPCVFSTAADTGIQEQEDRKDFWGRTYETSRYQWLPTYFTISPSGSCSISDYINNLSPRNHPLNAPLYDSLAKLFEQCLPFIESVYSYVRTVRPKMRDGPEDEMAGEAGYRPLDVKPCSLRGQKLQVITKIVDYVLQPGQSHTGVWHVEGMSHEEIVLTALYIADRDESIEGAALQFKRAFFSDEVTHLFWNLPQARPEAVEERMATGLTPLGTVETPKGRLIVFPNSHVHRVEEMVNSDIGANGKAAKRRIVVFFLVNPLRRIVSTREVAPQQVSEGGSMELDDALAHRLQLMEERKFHKQDWNVREIELCEH